MGWRASSSLVLIASSLAVLARAEGHGTKPAAPARLAAKHDAAAVAFRPASFAVAAFPDVVPERPRPPADPALELLADNPYAAALMARKIAINLYGEESTVDDPYADERRLANPYTDDVRLASPYTNPERLDNPYEDTLRLDDPYRRARQ